MNMELYIPDIPETSQQRIVLEPTPEELAEMFDDMGEFHVVTSAPVELEVRAQKFEDTVRLVGDAGLTIGFRCGRCLGDRQFELFTRFEYILTPSAQWQTPVDEEEEIELSAEELDVIFFDGEEIALEPLIREAVVLELPTFAACLNSMRAECDATYEALIGDEVQAAQEEAAVDLRWSKLLALKKDMEQE